MAKQKKFKEIPDFKNEDEERKFWSTHDSTDYFDMDNPVVFDLSELKPSTRPITVRLPESLLSDLKILFCLSYLNLIKNIFLSLMDRM